MRLIDADKLMGHLMDWALHDNATEIRECMEAVKEQPTVDPVKHGHWERHYSGPNVYADMFWHCSGCGYKNRDQWAYRYHNYCLHCGAYMMDEVEE